MEDILKQAYLPHGVSWRHIGGAEICRIETTNPPGDEKMISLPLDELLPIIADHLSRHSNAKVLLNHEVTKIGEEADRAWVDVTTPEGGKRLEATYVVGCDGGNSTIRKLLFDGRFPGFTWDKQIVATNVSSWFSLSSFVFSFCY